MLDKASCTPHPWVRSLGGEDPLEKGMATHSSILAWRIPWTEEPVRLHSPWSCKESDRAEWLTHLHFLYPRIPKHLSTSLHAGSTFRKQVPNLNVLTHWCCSW